MKYFIKRNLLIFFRDRGSVFFSLLGVLVIIGLYILFLGDVMVNNIRDLPGARFMMDSWIMAGLLAVTPITTSLGALGNILVDRKYGMYNDFAASPLKRRTIVSGYLLSAFFISLILTLLTFVLGELYIVLYGGRLLPLEAALKVLALVLFTTVSSSIMMFHLVTWFKSINAFSAASTITGTLIGFLTGIYIPIGSLPGPIQTVIKLFPPSHAAVLIRSIMMEEAQSMVFAGAPAEALRAFRLELGVAFEVGGRIISPYISLSYMACFMALFFVLTLIRINKKQV